MQLRDDEGTQLDFEIDLARRAWPVILAELCRAPHPLTLQDVTPTRCDLLARHGTPHATWTQGVEMSWPR